MGGVEAVASAPAKINLALRVGARRSDGFHPLNSLFHAVDRWERVSVRSGRGSRDELAVRGPGADMVPLDSSNLALRAAAWLRRAAGAGNPGAAAPVRLTIDKTIPVAGGLAGGSADAAAALIALNRFWDLGLSRARLVELAGELGSDVPFAVVGGCAIGTGRGESLAPVAHRGRFEWVLATSPEGLSTPRVFGRFDELCLARGPEPAPIPPGLLAGLAAGDPDLVGANLVNDLQAAALALRPELEGVIEAAREAGACGAIVSGSGPTVACLAATAEAADALAADLRGRLADLSPGAGLIRAAGPAAQ
ncbi:MAG: 4-(cytidine 5'-diphospho)-2-C-methyl-D-erythritol kinase [Bifidobacteriaceae bacterium]|jgi:4-diphosphocytidyl-2-C-methyl-D-erythritol kinase|nr:4-(cytidine 5'-diphospho)-2-C-methyl-D-erythritol kinase [Bifidobacteriaceae bacterium]